MNATPSSFLETDLMLTPALAALLEHLQRWPRAGGAGLYENLNYQDAGLCCCALDASLAAEQQATQVLEQAMSRARNRSTIQPKEDPNHGKS